MHDNHTESIRLTEKLLGRVDALSGAATGIAAAARDGAISSGEIYELLDVVADDLGRTARQLIECLTRQASPG